MNKPLPTATKADHDLAYDITHPNALSYEDRVECNIGEPLPLLLALMRTHGYEMPRRNGEPMDRNMFVGVDPDKEFNRECARIAEAGDKLREVVEQSAGAAAPVEDKGSDCQYCSDYGCQSCATPKPVELPALDVRWDLIPDYETTAEDKRAADAWWSRIQDMPKLAAMNHYIHGQKRTAQLSSALSESASLREENTKLHRRNCWLETGIACAKSDRAGMKALLDAYNTSGCDDADAMAAKYLEAMAEISALRSKLDEEFNAGVEAAANDIQPEGEPYTDVVEAIRRNILRQKRPIPTIEGGTR